MAIGLCGVQADYMESSNKRRLSPDSADERSRDSSNALPRAKRHRVAEAADGAHPRPSRDAIFRLSDELLVRVFSYFNERELVDMTTTSRRFYNLTSDSQLWRPLYYRRFVLPRAHLIPGFRTATSGRKDYKLHFGEGKELWADGGFGRSGGVVSSGPPDAASSKLAHTVDWKKSYKQWHNWERGRCSVDELPLHDIPFRRTFAKFVNGHAVTVDVISGLRVWDLRTRTLLSQADLRIGGDAEGTEPTCVTVDGQGLASNVLGIAVGLDDGTFGVWKLNVEERVLKLVCRHTVKRVGSLVALAYLHPFVVTATSAHLVVVYTLDHPISEASIQDTLAGAIDIDLSRTPTEPGPTGMDPAQQLTNENLIVPYLLLTFNGRNTMPPRALSIRKTASSIVASIAYTFNTYGGWCIGVQDFDIKPDVSPRPQVVMSRTASTPPKQSPQTRYSYEGSALRTWWPRSDNAAESDSDDGDDGYDSPVSLCYSHPYLLATMPDNTMMLHICTSTATSMSISAGTRLYGHTSAISDAAITPWGKAVSVSSQGNDIRLWKLEGGFDGSSVALQPTSSQETRASKDGTATITTPPGIIARARDSFNLDDRRNWVGFDDERVVVLKESRTGKESFMVYDFT
jgi:WD40 repeat protein